MTPLEPNREMLEQFISIVFKNVSKDGYISLRSYTDKGSNNRKPIHIQAIQVGDAELLDITCIRAQQAANWNEPAVFCPPVATFKNGKNATEDNIFEGPGLSVECDQNPVEARVKLEALLGTATAVVESGGEWTNPATGAGEPKVHLHWRLKKPTKTMDQHAMLKEARTLAAKLVGSDTSNNPIVHPIRWPGSWHRKKTPRLATIIASSDNEIDLNAALAKLRGAVGPIDSDDGKDDTGTGDPDGLARALDIIPNEDREWEEWNKIGMAIWAATGGSDIGRLLFDKWSAKSKKYDKAATEARWEHYDKHPPRKTGFGKLVKLARKYDKTFSIGPVIRLEQVEGEAFWYVYVQGSNKRIETDDMKCITRYQLFADVCAAQLGIGFPLMAQKTWALIVKDALAKMVPVKGEQDTTGTDMWGEWMETFLTNRSIGEKREDLLRHVPWEDDDGEENEEQRFYFTMKSLETFLQREKVKIGRKEIAKNIRAMDGEPQHLTIKNKRRRCWWVPSAKVSKAPELDPPNEEKDHI